MNLEEKTITGINQIHITDALNSALLELSAQRNSETTLSYPNNITIYVDKQDKSSPTEERREYIFPLDKQLRFLYVSQMKMIGDKFVMKFELKDNDIIMKTYVERYVSDYDDSGERHILSIPIIEETANVPIVLFDGENYIYTNYDVDGMDMELKYATNTEANKKIVNVAMYYNHKVNCSGEYLNEELYFKDAFTKTENKLNLEVDNAKVACITSKNNKFSLDEEGNLTVNSILFNNTNFNPLSMYPVGSIYMSVNDVNPSEYFGGTWVSWGAGKVPVGVDTTQAEFNTVEKSGGTKTHTLSINEIPSHSHGITGNGAHKHTYTGFIQCATSSSQTYTAIAHKRYDSDGTTTPASMNSSGGHSHSISNNGGSGSHNNLQPYITCYMWKRTA